MVNEGPMIRKRDAPQFSRGFARYQFVNRIKWLVRNPRNFILKQRRRYVAEEIQVFNMTSLICSLAFQISRQMKPSRWMDVHTHTHARTHTHKPSSYLDVKKAFRRRFPGNDPPKTRNIWKNVQKCERKRTRLEEQQWRRGQEESSQYRRNNQRCQIVCRK